MSAISSKSPGESKGDVEAVDIGLFEPGSMSSATFPAADATGRAADADMLDDLAHGPDPVRIGAGDVIQRGAAGVVLTCAPAGRDRRSKSIPGQPTSGQRASGLMWRR
jgi:hypothetical protein